MRVLIQFRAPERTIPRDYRQLLLSLFKRALSEWNGGAYLDRYFGHAERKPFSFAASLPGARFEGEQVHLNADLFTVTLSCGDSETFIILTSALLALKNQVIPTSCGSIALIGMKMLPVRSCGSRERFRLMSPLCVREHDRVNRRDHFHSFASDQFISVLRNNLKHELTGRFDADSIDRLEIEIHGARKTVVKLKGIMIEATLGEVELAGDPDLIQWIYDNGFGSKTTTFGLLG